MVDLVLDILTEIFNLAGSTMEQLLEEIASFNGIGTIAQMSRVSNTNIFFSVNFPKPYRSTSFKEMFH